MESKTLRSHRVIGEVADGTPQTCAFYDLGGVGYCAARVGGDALQRGHGLRVVRAAVVQRGRRLLEAKVVVRADVPFTDRRLHGSGA